MQNYASNALDFCVACGLLIRRTGLTTNKETQYDHGFIINNDMFIIKHHFIGELTKSQFTEKSHKNRYFKNYHDRTMEGEKDNINPNLNSALVSVTITKHKKINVVVLNSITHFSTQKITNDIQEKEAFILFEEN